MSCACGASLAANSACSLKAVTDAGTDQGVGGMAEHDARMVAVGSSVRIRPLRRAAPRDEQAPASPCSAAPDVIVTIVPRGEGGLHRLTPDTLLGRALLGHRPGDVVQVATEAGTVRYEVLAVARVAEAVDAEGPGSKRGVGTNADLTVRIGDVVYVRDGDLEEWWRIVPADVADVRRRWMSAATPMARALLGHRAGDEVRVER